MRIHNALRLLLFVGATETVVYVSAASSRLSQQAAFAFVPALRSKSSWSSPSRLHVGTAPSPLKPVDVEEGGMPQLGDDGIYHILNKEQHQ
jgi:hypothetical protein